MGTNIGKEKIQREKGYLHYLGKDGYIWASPMKFNKDGKKKKVGTEKIAREKGLPLLPQQGWVHCTSQNEERLIFSFIIAAIHIN